MSDDQHDQRSDSTSATFSKSVRSSFKSDSLYIDLGITRRMTMTAKNEIRMGEHFSMREYVSGMRKKNANICFPFASDGTNVSDLELQKLPLMHAPKFRWWRCESSTQESGAGGAANSICSPSPVKSDKIVHPDVPEHDKSDGRKAGPAEADRDHDGIGSEDDIQEITREDYDMARNKKRLQERHDLDDHRDDDIEQSSFRGDQQLVIHPSDQRGNHPSFENMGNLARNNDNHDQRDDSSHRTFPRRRKPRKMRLVSDLLGINGNGNLDDKSTTTATTSDAPPTREGLLRSISEKMAQKIECIREKMDLRNNENQNGVNGLNGIICHNAQKPHEEGISDDIMEIAEFMAKIRSGSENCNTKESTIVSSRLQHLQNVQRPDHQLVVDRLAQEQDDKNPADFPSPEAAAGSDQSRSNSGAGSKSTLEEDSNRRRKKPRVTKTSTTPADHRAGGSSNRK